MEVTLFGVGAAGNKAAINAIEKNVIAEDHVHLLNTTLRDIPSNYKINDSTAIKFSSQLGGCGKEPSKGREAIMNAIVEDQIDLSSLVNVDTRAIVIVTSIEGGTGCGSTPVIAKYFEALNIPVHIFAFIGFQDELRGVSNSLKFFNDLGELENITVHTIMNEAFLDFTNSYTKAEAAANDEFAAQLEILIGSKMIPSTQNIDPTDHNKLLKTYGYMDIKHIPLTNMKNKDSTNQAIIEKFDKPTCLDYNPGCKRLAIIINASERTQDAIDNSFSVIKRYTGEPVETYRHIQDDPSSNEEYMDIIVGGLAFPEQSIIDMSKKYSELKDKLNTKGKGFSDIFNSLDLDVDEIDEYNVDVSNMNDPNDAKSQVEAMFGKDASNKKSNKRQSEPKLKEKTDVIKTVDNSKSLEEDY